MARDVHPSAVVDPTAELADSVIVGPYAVIGPAVKIGAGTEIAAGAQIGKCTTLGEENQVYPHACLGFDPQDLKYLGEETFLEIGDRNHFREFCTVNRGTGAGAGTTIIGSDNLFMAYTHIAHDCVVGNRIVFANAGTLAGHVEVGDDAVVGAFTSVHQFCRVGCHAYIGGYSVIVQDALPFMKTVGIKPACLGLNRIGLERKGTEPEELRALESAARVLLRSKKPTGEAVTVFVEEFPDSRGVAYLAEFIRASERGVITRLPGQGRQRGAG